MVEMKNVLVIAAHPDDEVLGVGGTIPILRSQGGRVTVLIVTDGSSAQYFGDAEIHKTKRAQMEQANRILGTDELIQWDLPDMRLDSLDHVDLTSKFSQFIQDGAYDTVFFHSDVDINMDHKVIHHAVLVATRPTPQQQVRNLFTYYVSSSTEWGGRAPHSMFFSNYVVDVSTSLATKLDAMKAYREELRPFPHPRSLEAIDQRARVFGSEVGFEAAEPFSVILCRM